MVFSSIFFLLYFLPIFLLVYHFIDQKYKNHWILLASIFFYAWGAPKFIFVVLGVALCDYWVVNQMHQAQGKKKKAWLITSLSLNLGLLVYFKYANFFVENLNALLEIVGLNAVSWLHVALPIGISFYIFQSLTYALDVYRGHYLPVQKFAHYLLFILCFPQLIAGPIVKFNEISHQLAERKESVDDKLLGFYRFCIGLAKKVMIANVMAVYANQILDGDVANFSSATVWIGILAYTFQIYFDFAGYSDMAIGLGRMMGFTFPENFDSPYLSKNISEFWRRWHITLGTFMKEYLYIPLGGNRVSSKSRLYANLATVFILSGLWHGASWNFVLWGAFHGAFLILDRIFLIQFLNKIGSVFATFFTFFIVVVGWAIFRMENFDAMKLVLTKLFSFDSIHDSLIIHKEFYLIFTLAIACSILTAFRFGQKLQNYFLFQKEASVSSHFLQISVAILLFVLCLASLSATNFNPFIYYRF